MLTVLDGDNYGEYKVEAIRDSAVYARESESSQLPRLYYLLFWKGYPEEKNIWEPVSAVQYLKKLISLFHKDHPDKPTAISKAINISPPMAKPTATEAPKRKKG